MSFPKISYKAELRHQGSDSFWVEFTYNDRCACLKIPTSDGKYAYASVNLDQLEKVVQGLKIVRDQYSIK